MFRITNWLFWTTRCSNTKNNNQNRRRRSTHVNQSYETSSVSFRILFLPNFELRSLPLYCGLFSPFNFSWFFQFALREKKIQYSMTATPGQATLLQYLRTEYIIVVEEQASLLRQDYFSLQLFTIVSICSPCSSQLAPRSIRKHFKV